MRTHKMSRTDTAKVGKRAKTFVENCNLACFQAGQITKKGQRQLRVDIYNFWAFVVIQTMAVNLKTIYLLIFQL